MGSPSLAAHLAQEIATGRWSEGEALPACGQSRERLGAHLGQRPALTPRSGMPASSPASPRSRFVVAADGAARAARWGGEATALRLGGSDDPALDLLVRAMGDAIAVVPGPRGSVNGIVQLARGAADAVTLHLLDAASGRWNDPIARGALGGEPVELVHLWRREQGLVVAPRQPARHRGPGDLDGRRIAWRPPGTGSRLLLERLMLTAGCVPRPELGEPAESHLAVAAAVATGAADAGLAVRAVAESAGLGWVPLMSEPFELALDPATRDGRRAVAGHARRVKRAGAALRRCRATTSR